MKKSILLILLSAFILCSCSDKEDESVFISVGKERNVLVAEVDNTELNTFALVNQVDLTAVEIRIGGTFTSNADISETELQAKWSELKEKPFIAYPCLKDKNLISFSLKNMNQKEYQEQWKQVRETLSLVPSEDMKVEVVFEEPVDKGKEWIEKLNDNPLVKCTYTVTEVL